MDPLLFKLVRVADLATRRFRDDIGRQHQLTLNEWRVLALLGVRGGLSATQVAEATGMDKMSASRAVAGLSRRRRLQRHDDPADQRRGRLYLTRAGKALCDTVGAQGAAHGQALFAALPAADRTRLDALLERLIAGTAT